MLSSTGDLDHTADRLVSERMLATSPVDLQLGGGPLPRPLPVFVVSVQLEVIDQAFPLVLRYHICLA